MYIEQQSPAVGYNDDFITYYYMGRDYDCCDESSRCCSWPSRVVAHCTLQGSYRLADSIALIR
jgi:hypothetical protein